MQIGNSSCMDGKKLRGESLYLFKIGQLPKEIDHLEEGTIQEQSSRDKKSKSDTSSFNAAPTEPKRASGGG